MEDLYLFENFTANHSEYKKNNSEVKKRLTKRKIIETIISSQNTLSNLGRKMRAELIGMDGACIIDKNGELISFGAIIKNEPGSSGGGRGAATKQLSTFGGFAIKISTDGYIEVYVDSRNISDKIKKTTIWLFQLYFILLFQSEYCIVHPPVSYFCLLPLFYNKYKGLSSAMRF